TVAYQQVVAHVQHFRHYEPSVAGDVLGTVHHQLEFDVVVAAHRGSDGGGLPVGAHANVTRPVLVVGEGVVGDFRRVAGDRHPGVGNGILPHSEDRVNLEDVLGIGGREGAERRSLHLHGLTTVLAPNPPCAEDIDGPGRPLDAVHQGDGTILARRVHDLGNGR